tara:strand:- start:266 stop:460 length:195 start_codon:yes stop_codon:yes gene_type:complete
MAKLQVTELDFDDIKENLKTYLRAQTKFKDYDFEGSGRMFFLILLHTILTIWLSMQIWSPMKCF